MLLAKIQHVLGVTALVHLLTNFTGSVYLNFCPCIGGKVSP